MEQKLALENGANQAKQEKGERTFEEGDRSIGIMHRLLLLARRLVFYKAFTQISSIKGDFFV